MASNCVVLAMLYCIVPVSYTASAAGGGRRELKSDLCSANPKTADSGVSNDK
jgi:hypothetical protein